MSNAPAMSSEEQGRVPGSGSPTSRKRTLDLGPKRSLEPGKEHSKPGGGGAAVWSQGLLGNLSRGAGGPREPGGRCQGAPGETRGGGGGEGGSHGT